MADYQEPDEKQTQQRDEYKRTKSVIVTTREEDLSDALEMTEKFGSDRGLSKKDVLQLRLLAEEQLGILRNIAGDVNAKYWAEIAGKKFELHMRSKVQMSEELRQQLLSASTSGENAAEKGLIGKIRVMVAEAMLSLKNSTDAAISDLPPEIDEGAPLSPASGMDAYVWSMENYKEEIQNQMDDSEDAAEAWDELEKSIVGKLADEVSVRIIGASVEIIVFKEFHD